MLQVLPNAKPSEVLNHIADEFEKDNSLWTKYSYARDKNGDTTSVFNPNAVCFCSLGAITKVTNYNFADVSCKNILSDLLKHTMGLRYNKSIITFNDSPETTIQDVIAAFRKAAEIAKKCEEQEERKKD